MVELLRSPWILPAACALLAPRPATGDAPTVPEHPTVQLVAVDAANKRHVVVADGKAMIKAEISNDALALIENKRDHKNLYQMKGSLLCLKRFKFVFGPLGKPSTTFQAGKWVDLLQGAQPELHICIDEVDFLGGDDLEVIGSLENVRSACNLVGILDTVPFSLLAAQVELRQLPPGTVNVPAPVVALIAEALDRSSAARKVAGQIRAGDFESVNDDEDLLAAICGSPLQPTPRAPLSREPGPAQLTPVVLSAPLQVNEPAIFTAGVTPPSALRKRGERLRSSPPLASSAGSATSLNQTPQLKSGRGAPKRHRPMPQAVATTASVTLPALTQAPEDEDEDQLETAEAFLAKVVPPEETPAPRAKSTKVVTFTQIKEEEDEEVRSEPAAQVIPKERLGPSTQAFESDEEDVDRNDQRPYFTQEDHEDSDDQAKKDGDRISLPSVQPALSSFNEPEALRDAMPDVPLTQAEASSQSQPCEESVTGGTSMVSCDPPPQAEETQWQSTALSSQDSFVSASQAHLVNSTPSESQAAESSSGALARDASEQRQQHQQHQHQHQHQQQQQQERHPLEGQIFLQEFGGCKYRSLVIGRGWQPGCVRVRSNDGLEQDVQEADVERFLEPDVPILARAGPVAANFGEEDDKVLLDYAEVCILMHDKDPKSLEMWEFGVTVDSVLDRRFTPEHLRARYLELKQPKKAEAAQDQKRQGRPSIEPTERAKSAESVEPVERAESARMFTAKDDQVILKHALRLENEGAPVDLEAWREAVNSPRPLFKFRFMPEAIAARWEELRRHSAAVAKTERNLLGAPLVQQQQPKVAAMASVDWALRTTDGSLSFGDRSAEPPKKRLRAQLDFML